MWYFLALLILLLPKTVFAICPVCTIAVGAGIGLSRWFGIDDTITGLWLGGFLVSLTILTENWLTQKKFWPIKYRWFFTLLAYFILTFVPLYFTGILGHPLNTLWGVDKIFLGAIIGGLIFYWFGFWSYKKIKKLNSDRALFPFQKVVMPLAALLILSLIFEWLVL